EQMLLALKDEVGAHLDDEENDFMLDNAYGDNTLEELNAAIIMMARIQPTDDKSNAKPTYDAEFISEVSASQVDMINGLLSKSDHEQRHHEKLETITHTSADDQIDSDIIFDNPYVENNSGQAKHDTNAHDQSLHDFESLIIIVQVEAEKQRKKNIEPQKQKALLQKELKTCKERVKEFENKPEQPLGYKEAYEKLENEINFEKEQLFNEKEEIRKKLLKTQGETLKIKRDTDLYKKPFKKRENKYLEDIVSLEEKLHSQDQIVSEKSDLPLEKMPNESKLLKLFVDIDNKLNQLGILINNNIQREKERTVRYNAQNEIQKYFTNEVIPISRSLRKYITTIKQEITEEVYEMLEIFMSMEQKVEEQVQNDKPFQNDIDRLLEASLEREIRDCVLISVEQQKNERLMFEMEKISSESKDIQVNLLKRIKILENDFQCSQAQIIDFELKLQHQKEQIACDVSWRSQMAKLNGENMSLNIQIESLV
ncbi:hypothetical protein Tco_1419652, partial [Tanacetum coccineum]